MKYIKYFEAVNKELKFDIDKQIIIRFLTENAMQHVKAYYEEEEFSEKKAVKFSHIFKNNLKLVSNETVISFIKRMFEFFDEEGRTPSLIMQKLKFSIINHQTGESDNGSYNIETSDISISLRDKDLFQIKKTLSHEFSHLYDDVLHRTSNSHDHELYRQNYTTDYDEILARVYGFLNSNQNWKNTEEVKDDFLHITRAKSLSEPEQQKLINIFNEILEYKKNEIEVTILPLKKKKNTTEIKFKDVSILWLKTKLDKASINYEYRIQDGKKVLKINDSFLDLSELEIDFETGEVINSFFEDFKRLIDKEGLFVIFRADSLSLVHLFSKESGFKTQKFYKQDAVGKWDKRNFLYYLVTSKENHNDIYKKSEKEDIELHQRLKNVLLNKEQSFYNHSGGKQVYAELLEKFLGSRSNELFYDSLVIIIDEFNSVVIFTEEQYNKYSGILGSYDNRKVIDTNSGNVVAILCNYSDGKMNSLKSNLKIEKI